MERAYNLIIVDDHSIFRDAIRFVLEQSRHVNIIGEASNGHEFLNLIRNVKPDVVLMDIAMPGLDGVDTTREAIKKYPDLKIIALSLYGEEPYYYRMIEAGAQGFVVKDSGSDELLKAIFTVMHGDSYFSNSTLCNIIRDYPDDEAERSGPKKEIRFSKRENEVLDLICAGLSNAEIAEKMGVSKRTVEGHRGSLIAKTGARSTIQLVLYALKSRSMAS